MEDEVAVFAACVAVLNNPTKQTALELKNTLYKVPKGSLQHKQKVIYGCITSEISKSQSTELKLHLIDSLKELLLYTRVIKNDLFSGTYSLLLNEISELTESRTLAVADVPEELKLSVIQCLKVLFVSSSSDIIEGFYDEKNYSAISWAVMLCKKIAEEERMTALRTEAVECILYITHCNDEADPTDIVLRDGVKKIVRKIMPGILSLAATVCRNTLGHHRIVQMGIRLWSRIILLAMSDDCESSDNSLSLIEEHHALLNICAQFSVKVKSNSVVSDSSSSTSKSEEKDWLNKAASSVAGVSRIIINCQLHSHHLVREELSTSIRQILSHCSKNMQPSFSCFIECLLTLSQDKIKKVSCPTQEFLKNISVTYKSQSGKSFIENIKESFYLFLTKFPRIMLSDDMITHMNLLNGYLCLLGSHVPQFLSSKTHLNRLIFCVIQVVKIDVSRISLLADPSVRVMETGELHSNVQWKNMILLHGDEVLTHLERICSVLRGHANLSNITYTLLDYLNEYQEYTNELLLIVNTLLTSGSSASMAQNADLLKEVVNFYLDLPVWPASEILNKSLKSGPRHDQFNVVQLCLAVEGIGLMANAVGKDIFNVWLLQCLYAVLEAAGSPLEIVACAGLNAIHNIAKECSGADLTALICNNTDYLTHHITRRLRHYHRHPGLLAVLSVIMQHSSAEVIPSLHEIISDVLQQSYDAYQINNMDAYLRTFITFISSIRRWSANDVSVNISNNLDEKSIGDPLEELFEYMKSKDIVEKMNSGEESDDEMTLVEKFARCQEEACNKSIDYNSNHEGEDEDAENSKKKDVPMHIQLVVDILERSIHFLPSKDYNQQILVMQVLEEGVALLKSYPDKLLPVVHSIWSPLVNRFQGESNEPLIMNRAFLLLQVLASTSRDFIKMRTLRDILPSIWKFLKESSTVSVLKDTKSAYRMTQQYKLQKILLEGLGKLAIDVDLAEAQIYETIISSSPYLSSLQPQPLQDACIDLFKTLTKKSADLVWLHLNTIWSPKAVLQPPSPQWPFVQLLISSGSEYKKNVQLLMKLFNTNISNAKQCQL